MFINIVSLRTIVESYVTITVIRALYELSSFDPHNSEVLSLYLVFK